MIKNYFKIAWRSLQKNKVTSFINVGGLAIGMAVAILVGLWLQDELTYNKYHKNYDRLAQIRLHQTVSEKVTTSRSIALPSRSVLEDQFGSDFKNLSLASWNFQHVLTHEKKQFLKRGLYVEPSFPEMFSLEFIAGNFETALNEPRSIVISESMAKSFFDEKEPLGKTIRLDAVEDLKVTGVFKDLPYNNTLKESEYLIPWSLYTIQEPWVKESETNWGEHSFQLFAQMEDQADMEVVSTKIKDIEFENNPGAKPAYFLFPMSKWYLYPRFEDGINTGGRIQFVWLLGFIGLFVLILACINFMNLSTAQSEKRAKEVGIRKTIGSMRSQLIGQFLSESLLVAIVAMFLALILAYLCLNGFNDIADKKLTIPHSSSLFWLAIFGFTLFTGLLAGSYPAFYLSSFKPLKVLKGTFNSGKNSKLPRQILVTMQFTVSIALIIGTIVVYQQIQHAKDRPMGYNKNSVIQFMSNNETTQKPEVFRNELLQTGKVEEVAFSFSPITEVWSNGTGFSWEGKDENVLMSFGKVSCSHEFGKVVGWQIKEGRDFSREFSTDTSAMILNEAAVAQTGMDDIIGKTITFGRKPYQVIGVINNIIMESPWQPIKPTVFRLDPQRINVHTIKLKSDIPVQEAIVAVNTVFKKHSPSSPFEYEFTDAEYNEKFEIEERIGNLAKILAFLAIFISCLGLFGLSAYLAERKTKEIGIRKVLGASVANLWAMQSKGFISLILLACLIASPIAWYLLEGWLSDYTYRIELRWSVFAVSAILALVVTLLTVSYQSIKAALTNPVKSLKNE